MQGDEENRIAIDDAEELCRFYRHYPDRPTPEKTTWEELMYDFLMLKRGFEALGKEYRKALEEIHKLNCEPLDMEV